MNPNYPKNGAVPLPNASYPMARLSSSAYAAPLNYNQSTEVVGGYDAKINPMTGEEVPQTNFAGGGSVRGLAALVASPYRDSDVMRVKMTPREVAGLQQLALAYGADERDLYDPVTGEPRFSFLKKILPMVAGALLGPAGMGMSSFGAAATVGLGYGLLEGDLKKGLMAGLGAYSGAGISAGLKAAAGVEVPSSQVVTPAAGASFKDLPSTIEPTLSSYASTPTSALTGQPTVASLGGGMGGAIGASAAQAATTVKPPQGFFGTMGRGVSNIFTGQEGASDAFMKALGGPMGKYATLMGAVGAFADEPKPFKVPGMGEDIIYIPGGFNPQYGTGANQPYQLPGKYYKRTDKGLVPYNPYRAAPGAGGFAEGGIITDPLSIQEDPNVIANRKYVEELNRRAMSPEFNPYGAIVGGGLGGTNAPWTGKNPYGGSLDTRPGAGSGETGGSSAGDLAGFLATQVGINWLTQPGNAAALQKWIADGMPWDKRPFFNAGKDAPKTGTPGETTPGETTPGETTPGETTPGETTPGEGSQTGQGDQSGQGTQPGAGSGVESAIPAGLVGTAVGAMIAAGGKVRTVGAVSEVLNPYTGVWEKYNPQTGEIIRLDTPGTGGAPSTGTETGQGPGQTGTEAQGPQDQGQAQTGDQTQPSGGEGQPYYDPVNNVVIAGGASAAAIAAAKALAASKGVLTVTLLDGTVISAGGVAAGTGAAAGAGAAAGTGAATGAGVGTTGAGVGTTGAGVGTTGATTGAGTGAGAGLGGAAFPGGVAGAGLAALVGAQQAYEGISKGKEGQAALGGALAGAGGAALLGGTAPAVLGGANLATLAGFGPVGLAAAAIAAIGASLVNTKEQGAKSLQNYWKGVEQGRGFGQSHPDELTNGFINFYRTNKNQFPGQEKYGRTGNENFLYDMTQVINSAVKDGKVASNADANEIYKSVVEPWINSFGYKQNIDASTKKIQDFLLTDLIYNFMLGNPISHGQVKGDKTLKIVTDRPVYAGQLPESMVGAATDKSAANKVWKGAQLATTKPFDYGAFRAAAPTSANPFATPTTASPAANPFAASEDRVTTMPVGETEPIRTVTEQEPVRLTNKEKAAIIDALPPQTLRDLVQSVNPFAEESNETSAEFNQGGAIGEDYNFGFNRGGVPGEYQAGGKLLNGPGDGMSDDIPAVIRGKGVQRAALADGEFVIPADVVSHLGNGSTNAGAKKLYKMMAQVRQARTGKSKQAPSVKTDRFLPV